MSFITVYQFIKFNNKNSFFISIVINIFLCLAVAISLVSGWDWGRWISMYSIISLFLLNLLSIVYHEIKEFNQFINFKSIIFKNRVTYIIILFISFLFFLAYHTELDPCCPKGPVIEFRLPRL